MGEHATEGFYGWVTLGNYSSSPFASPSKLAQDSQLWLLQNKRVNTFPLFFIFWFTLCVSVCCNATSPILAADRERNLLNFRLGELVPSPFYDILPSPRMCLFVIGEFQGKCNLWGEMPSPMHKMYRKARIHFPAFPLPWNTAFSMFSPRGNVIWGASLPSTRCFSP